MRPSKKRAHASLSESQEVNRNSNSNSSGDDERCAKRRNTKEDQTARSSGGNRPSRSLTTDCDNGETATHNQHQQQSQVDSTTYYSCNDNSDADEANAAAITRVSLSPPGQRNESIGNNREQLQQFTELRQRQRAEAASLLNNNNNNASSAGSLPVSTGSENSTNNNQRNERISRHVVHQPQLQSRQRGLSTTLFMLLNRAILFLVWSLFVTKFGSSILATTDTVKQHPDNVFNSSIMNYPSEEDHCNILESELSSQIEEMERRALVSKMQYQSKIDQLERQVVMEQNNCFSDQKRLHETQSKLEELERLTNVKQALDQQEEQEKLLDQIEQLKKDLAFTISQCVAV